jgi:hypothetical protein
MRQEMTTRNITRTLAILLAGTIASFSSLGCGKGQGKRAQKCGAVKLGIMRNFVIWIVLGPSVVFSGCGVPSNMDVSVMDNGIRSQTTMRYTDMEESLLPKIQRNTMLVVFDGLFSGDMNAFCENLKKEHTDEGVKVTVIKYADNRAEAVKEAEAGYAAGMKIVCLSYSNSNSTVGVGGRNGFIEAMGAKGILVNDLRWDDTWRSDVHDNVSIALFIRGNALFNAGSPLTKERMKSPHTIYSEIYAPVSHLSIVSRRLRNNYWYLPKVIDTINDGYSFVRIIQKDTIDRAGETAQEKQQRIEAEAARIEAEGKSEGLAAKRAKRVAADKMMK